MERRLVSQLGVERDRQDVALADRHRMTVDLGEDFDVLAVSFHPELTSGTALHQRFLASVRARSSPGPPGPT